MQERVPNIRQGIGLPSRQGKYGLQSDISENERGKKKIKGVEDIPRRNEIGQDRRKHASALFFDTLDSDLKSSLLISYVVCSDENCRGEQPKSLNPHTTQLQPSRTGFDHSSSCDVEWERNRRVWFDRAPLPLTEHVVAWFYSGFPCPGKQSTCKYTFRFDLTPWAKQAWAQVNSVYIHVGPITSSRYATRNKTNKGHSIIDPMTSKRTWNNKRKEEENGDKTLSINTL
ncbi:predicted protein [Histoplasma capsulatum var. duboisii H88]|uniref:Predicted protein n=2 Tax=Ajellomyces capsulatus TaxID=5037 RepID=F0ULZ4_AJEC8|nr:predicted protein [Histoplasma capsulatum H143]EGC48038.1 predicted protein [Histoplasma capsulatum var. duboisii H88]